MTIRVLICDDVPELRELYRLWLEQESDIELVGEARDGNEAISMTHDLHPDVLLLDVAMPLKNGFEVLDELSRTHPETKVIMLTGFEGSRIGSRARRLGAIDIIEKGTSLDRVAERIRAAVG